MKSMTLETAKHVIKAAEQKAKELRISQVIAIVDEGGNFTACHRMDDAWLASIDIAQNKAWTAVALRMPTSHLAHLAAPHAELYGINTTNHGRVVVFGGGIPLVREGRIVGAVGVSGSTVANDVEVAKAAVHAFESYASHMPQARRLDWAWIP
ncbi:MULTISPECIES: GlcG/HbpS family heme-binding protein [Paenibacillus]|uniref:Heme-binding protein n=1 Tax=Paenibacillus validus TaxID=44253 RepID=A0A7X2Z6T4_9BACL|nr:MULTISPECIES: heme-binding protein [Paenibacillus]MUG69381.1 heme-binding protein [Paenibacillus validus]